MADFKIKSAAGTGNKTLIQGQDQSGSNYAIEIGDGGALKLGTITSGTFPAGHVIGVENTIKLDTYTQSATSTPTAVTGLNVTITPKQTGSKILCIADFGLSTDPGTGSGLAYLQRKVASGSYATIGAGTGASNRVGVNAYMMPTDVREVDMITLQHLDSPSYTAGQTVTYTVSVSTQGSVVVYIGRTGSDVDAAYVGRMSSHITVMEVAQ